MTIVIYLWIAVILNLGYLTSQKGQLIGIKRNCATGSKFKDKGYTQSFVQNQIDYVSKMDRAVMLQMNNNNKNYNCCITWKHLA